MEASDSGDPGDASAVLAHELGGGRGKRSDGKHVALDAAHLLAGHHADRLEALVTLCGDDHLVHSVDEGGLDAATKERVRERMRVRAAAEHDDAPAGDDPVADEQATDGARGVDAGQVVPHEERVLIVAARGVEVPSGGDEHEPLAGGQRHEAERRVGGDALLGVVSECDGGGEHLDACFVRCSDERIDAREAVGGVGEQGATEALLLVDEKDAETRRGCDRGCGEARRPTAHDQKVHAARTCLGDVRLSRIREASEPRELAGNLLHDGVHGLRRIHEERVVIHAAREEEVGGGEDVERGRRIDVLSLDLHARVDGCATRALVRLSIDAHEARAAAPLQAERRARPVVFHRPTHERVASLDHRRGQRQIPPQSDDLAIELDLDGVVDRKRDAWRHRIVSKHISSRVLPGRACGRVVVESPRTSKQSPCMSNLSTPKVPTPRNEPVLGYAPGSPERAALERELGRQASTPVEVPLLVEPDGRPTHTGNLVDIRSPHDHALVLGRFHRGGAAEASRAIETALAAQRAWVDVPFEERAAIFLRAAERISGRDRARILAATMLGQSKTAHQAEIDAACELADFLRFNVHFAEQILAEQPASDSGIWNRSEARPLEGFVYAVTPFNFTAIAGNLPTAPALLGNVVLWKPAENAMLSSWHVMDILRECGLPPGVITFVTGDPVEISRVAMSHPMLAGVHFTGSTAVFQQLWKQTADNLSRYRSYPRIVGETGGKDFIVAHPSADATALSTAILRGGFEYQGQKCSAASRVYVPRSLWPEVRDRLVSEMATIKLGPVTDFSNFMGAVIDKKAFDRITSYQKLAREEHTILAGGGANGDRGWFVEPTLVETKDPHARLMCEEIFGPVVTTYVYDDAKWADTLRLVDETSPYALTGAVFCRETAALLEAKRALLFSAGNFYVNDKPTGAVVGQQPFGGARASGTNDKAGSLWNLVRWLSPRTVKETLSPPHAWRYPFMG